MYDLDGNNFISRDELLAVLHMMVGANISEEQVRQRWLKGQRMNIHPAKDLVEQDPLSPWPVFFSH